MDRLNYGWRFDRVSLAKVKQAAVGSAKTVWVFIVSSNTPTSAARSLHYCLAGQ